MRISFTFGLLLATLLSFSQVQPTYPVKKAEGRPTIGLCLSGGGAKGFAHIGIIKIIDSLGIPIDYVTGTSMGSIMGGLYAIGYTGKQIEESVESTDWLDLMNPTPQRQYQSFSSKDHAQRNLFTIGLEGFNVVLPAGLNSASKVYQKLHNVTIGYHGYQNFLKFPRGFICIGANINTGEEVVFTEGSLPDAMRASMSIPTIFTPHTTNGITIVDGGTLNNFPTDKLIELGCDIIIGIDLHSETEDSAAITLTSVLEKSAMFVNNRSYQKSIDRCDIHLHPDLTGLSGGDFGKSTEIIARGTAEGRAHLVELVALANSLKGAPKKEIPPYVQPDSVVISKILVNGLKKVSKAYVLGALDYEGEKIAISSLETSINAIYGSSYFNTVTCNLLKQTDNSYVLEVNLIENLNDLDIGVGIHHDPDFSTSFLLNFSARNALFKGSRFNLDAVVSERPRFRLLYEVDKGFKPGFGIRSNLYFTKTKLWFIERNLGNYTYDDWTSAVYIIFSANNKAVLRLGGEFNYAILNVRDVPQLQQYLDSLNNNPDATIYESNHLNLFGELKADVRDDNDYPKRGYYLGLEGRYHAGLARDIKSTFEDHFITLFASYQGAFSPTSWFTILPEATGSWSFINDPGKTFSYSVQLGGLGRNYFHYQIPFLGYNYMEAIQLSNLIKGGLELRFNPFGKHYISGIINYALWFDVFETGFLVRPGKPTQPIEIDEIDIYDFSGWGAKYGIDTFVGPLELTVHRNFDRGSWLFYFNLGYWF